MAQILTHGYVAHQLMRLPYNEQKNIKFNNLLIEAKNIEDIRNVISKYGNAKEMKDFDFALSTYMRINS
tara:strand:- start:59 stop:265 length:207 start_codon:yes stop_codon:yes gene_type:complete